MRRVITDEIRDVSGPLVERGRLSLGPEPGLPDRMFFEAVLYWARTGVPCRDLAGKFGAWDAVHKRLRRTCSDRLKRVVGLMVERPECEGLTWLMIDSTIA